ncbi:hypothetical protein Acr_10g0007130 [Actinidia rufa]|uniref:Reverse transcriptase/retrotransposon-derived protein RNase H-like domain-containing protein n=1 Tax=Actinidia rufa TaxID=165716 RepID=A0A7J0F9E8_9ERIC|nr:hypothetical protein Acr_10g0007130 [Actinidia rufa]
MRLYCYKVMPFRLKNAGVTYQRLVNKMFKDLIRDTMKVTKKGIEANPDQIEALMLMSSPKSIHDVQLLTGRVIALNRIVSKSADKCLPFFKILKWNKDFKWTNKSELAFQQLKSILDHPLF